MWVCSASRMATNRNTKLGFNIDKFVAKVKDGSHADPVQLVTEVCVPVASIPRCLYGSCVLHCRFGTS